MNGVQLCGIFYPEKRPNFFACQIILLIRTFLTLVQVHYSSVKVTFLKSYFARKVTRAE